MTYLLAGHRYRIGGRFLVAGVYFFRSSDWKLNEEWAWFIGNNRERLKLTTKPEPYSFQRTLNWLSHQVAPTLKVAIKLDEINQTQVVKDILDHAKLTDRHKQILKQQSVKEQDVITTKK